MDKMSYREAAELRKSRGRSGRVTLTSSLSYVEEETVSPRVLFIAKVIASPAFETFAGCVILLNFIVIVVETDYRAMHRRALESDAVASSAENALVAVWWVNNIFILFYSLECSLRFYVQGRRFFLVAWNNFDFFVLLSGLVGEVLSACLDASQVENMQLLRTFRMARLLRLSRVLVSFEELYALVCGITSCMRTLLWAASLIMLTLTVWSIISVEYISPLMPAIAQAGAYSTCSWCPSAFDSIMLSNLTFFQIISGDGWSSLARALIEEHPWAALVFIAVIFMVIFGQLNLIIAAIVDTAATAREDDILTLSKRREAERMSAWTAFSMLCLQLDDDGSGDISLEELKEGVSKSPELQAYMSVIGIEETDMEEMFEILDVDGDNLISHEEFCTQLYKMKTGEIKTNVHRVKHICTTMRETLMDMDQRVRWQEDMMRQLVAMLEVDGGGKVRQAVLSESGAKGSMISTDCKNFSDAKVLLNRDTIVPDVFGCADLSEATPEGQACGDGHAGQANGGGNGQKHEEKLVHGTASPHLKSFLSRMRKVNEDEVPMDPTEAPWHAQYGMKEDARRPGYESALGVGDYREHPNSGRQQPSAWKAHMPPHALFEQAAIDPAAKFGAQMRSNSAGPTVGAGARGGGAQAALHTNAVVVRQNGHGVGAQANCFHQGFAKPPDLHADAVSRGEGERTLLALGSKDANCFGCYSERSGNFQRIGTD